MNPRVIVRRWDERLGSPVAVLQKRLQLRARRSRFERDRARRRARYADSGYRHDSYAACVQDLHRDGFAIVRNVVDWKVLASIRAELERHLNSGAALNPISRDSARRAGDLAAPRQFLSAEEVTRGQEYFRQHTNFAAVSDPLLVCPSVVRVAFDHRLIDIAAGYLECLPAMTGLNLRKSFVNDLPDFDTLYFHSDPNSARFVKFFLYLNDVDDDGGPFTYVRGSHRRKFRGWMRKYRWTHDEIAAQYGESNIVRLTGNVGDLLMADTTGFHRGTRVRSRDRSMLTLDYLVHPEFDGSAPPAKIRAGDRDRLTPKQRAAADFLAVVA